MINFCTLFDVNYITRGMVLYHSLEQCCSEFTLYVMAMDMECYHLLSELEYEKMVVVHVSEMENSRLKEIKEKRTPRAYCWTCSSWSIRYFMDRYHLDLCTYIDADECYFSSPEPIIREFEQSDYDVAVTSHHLGNEKFARDMEKRAGKYCVQFNSFKNTEGGKAILNDWCDDCADACEEFSNGCLFGDQKYLENWNMRYPNRVWEYNDIGLGVAPWNTYRYREVSGKNGRLYDALTKREINIVFFHFHNLLIYETSANIGIFTRPGKHDKTWIIPMYKMYIKRVKDEETYLKKRGMMPQKEEDTSMKDKMPYLKKLKSSGVITTVVQSIKFRLMSKYDIIYFEK